jgi:hypothetical protein
VEISSFVSWITKKRAKKAKFIVLLLSLNLQQLKAYLAVSALIAGSNCSILSKIVAPGSCNRSFGVTLPE